MANNSSHFLLLLIIFSLAFVSLVVVSSAYGNEPAASTTSQPKHPLQKPKLEGSGSYVHEPEKTNFEKLPKVGHDGYGSEPKLMKKPVLEYGQSYHDHQSRPNLEKPILEQGYYAPKPKLEKPNLEHVKELLKTIGVQGLVYCHIGRKLIPIAGAVARVTCLAVTNENGYHDSAPFSVLSSPTDKKGYFYTTLASSELLEDKWKLSECKVFLESCPLTTCNVPTDVNKGLSGALISSSGPPHHFTSSTNKMNLYSVGPFVYTPNNQHEPKLTNS